MQLLDIPWLPAISVGLRPSRKTASTTYRPKPIAPPPTVGRCPRCPETSVHYLVKPHTSPSANALPTRQLHQTIDAGADDRQQDQVRNQDLQSVQSATSLSDGHVHTVGSHLLGHRVGVSRESDEVPGSGAVGGHAGLAVDQQRHHVSRLRLGEELRVGPGLDAPSFVDRAPGEVDDYA